MTEIRILAVGESVPTATNDALAEHSVGVREAATSGCQPTD